MEARPDRRRLSVAEGQLKRPHRTPARRHGGGLNGSYRLNATTVHDDAAIDTLFGEGGLDWFFAKLSGSYKDEVKDKATGEVITGL